MSTHPKPKCAKCRRVARVGHVCKPRKSVARKALPVRGERPKAWNCKRASREHVRAYGTDGRAAWVKTLPCAVDRCEAASENAHTQGGGMGRKGDADTIAPLCRSHHRFLHQRGPGEFAASFVLRHGWTLGEHAAHTEKLWQRVCDGWNTPDMWPGRA